MNANTTDPANDISARKRWVKPAAAGASALLIGAAIFGAAPALAAGTNPAPVAPSSATPTTPGAPAAGPAKHHGTHPFARILRQELRIDLQGKAGFGDRAHLLAYRLIHHKAAFAALPANLRADVVSLEGAAAAERDNAAARIKDTALAGGYGPQILKEAKAIQAKLAQAPATAAP
ncbi:MAG: hypothetical protein WBX27_07685 [Specibacter sp.]